MKGWKNLFIWYSYKFVKNFTWWYSVKLFCSNLQRHLCFILSFLHLSCFIIAKSQVPPLFPWIPKLSGIWFPISKEPCFHCICTTHSFLNAFILTFLVCINVCGKFQAILGPVSAETTVSIFHLFSYILPYPDLNTTHMSPKRLALGATPSWHCKEKDFMKFPCFLSLMTSGPE